MTSFYRLRPATRTQLDREAITRVLREADIPFGEHHRGGGWSDEGAPEYVPAVPGLVLTDAELRTDPGDPRRWTYHHAVTWAGRGRREGLERVFGALSAAGLHPVWGPRHPLGLAAYDARKQSVVVVSDFSYDTWHELRYGH